MMDFSDSSKKITHLAVRRPLGYFHHFIVIGSNNSERKIIEYSVSFFTSWTGRGEVIERDFSEDEIIQYIKGGNLYIIESPDHPKTKEEEENALKRCSLRIREKAYGIAYNNCEHLASYIATGKSRSDQIREKIDWQMVVVDTIQTVIVDVKTNVLTNLGYTFATVPALFLEKHRDKASSSIRWAIGKHSDNQIASFPRNVIESATYLARGTFEGAFLALKLDEMNTLKNLKIIDDKNFELEQRKLLFGLYGHAVGGVIGEMISPIPLIGYAAGSTIGDIGGRFIGSFRTINCPFCGGILFILPL